MRRDAIEKMMSITVGLQLAAFNVAVAALAMGLGQAAQPNDRFVHVVYPPWFTPAEMQRRIVTAGGAIVVGEIARLSRKVALRDPDMLARLADSGAVLILTASPAFVCARPSGGER